MRGARISLLRHFAKGAAVLALLAPLALAAPGPVDLTLITHEWGTFTSVADNDGTPVKWASLLGKPDLPCFVERLGPGNLKVVTAGLVRMETPVMYFYSRHSVTLSVRVQFPHGLITEWYPQANGGGTRGLGQIQWDSVQVAPQEHSELQSSQGESRYFAARNTDSTTLQIAGEQEKFIFYRGVGNFEIPLRARFVSDGKMEIRNVWQGSVPLAIVFEKHEGKIGYRVASSIRDSIEVQMPELSGNLSDLRQVITDSLVEFGLYQKEARAMLDTWQDSWFEEGTRVFYIVPRERVDSALPLEINPAPATIARVFVGRVEVLSPRMEQKIVKALNSGDTATLAKLGRFLDPFVKQLNDKRTLAESAASIQYLQEAQQQIAKEFTTASCIR